ncbi:MarR family winged helix-turn-helix transcriptional regulator [Paenibacillus sp. TAB 01]|uniref:MarR family winged helix-turn-helix transcriptional regulator n=1 Tax=Paenibacillus sp. TAB 01 TaxID=3368988 RepID=UPI00374FE799
MLTSQVMEELELTLQHIMRKMMHYNKIMDNHFSGSQVNALETIRSKQPLKVSELAEELFLSSSAVTLLCDKLIENGYVKRERITGDRRVVCMSITEQGNELLETLQDKERDLVSQWLSGITVQELQVLNQTLKKISENAKKHRMRS